MTKVVPPRSTVVGVLLMVAPLLALVVKSFSFGWMMVLVLFGPIVVLIAGYFVQVVIASQGFLSKRDLFGAARRRATAAAWTTSIGVVLFGLFAPDGGDASYGSTLQMWLGAGGANALAVHEATDGINDVGASLTAAAWIGGFIWLFIEWIVAISRRRQAARIAVRGHVKEPSQLGPASSAQ